MKHSLSLYWKAGSWLLAFLLFTPTISLVYEALTPSGEIFQHLRNTVLTTYIFNTVLLISGVGLLGLILALPAAWVMASHDLPGKKYLQWLLVLPLAMPSYVIAYIYTDLLEYAGPVQRAMRALTGWQSAADYHFPEIRSLGGAMIVLALVLYPYVYLLARTAFLEQSQSQVLASRLLGCSPAQSFFKVSMPMARPAIITGLALMGMETLGDFATVSYFAVPTLTSAVYDTWLGYGSLNAAAKISAIMLLVVTVLISLEKYSRRRQQLYQKGIGQDHRSPTRLNGWKKTLALFWCWMLVILGFALPAAILLGYVVTYFADSWRPELITYGLNSLKVSLGAAFFATLVALFLGLYQRLQGSQMARMPARLVSSGYAMPGNVLAIGVLIPLTLSDHGINNLIMSMGYSPVGLILSGSIIAIIFAYVVRFSAVAVGSVESSLGRVSPSLDMASRTLGCSPGEMVKRVHIPMVRKGLLTGFLLVFIEAMKELPAALLLRPFGFETLATWVFQYVSDEKLEHAAPAALILVLAGLLPLILLNRSLESRK
ncbi:iron ABC transporter permease [Endozoicomonas montiporae]|uniref:Iron ABC transporter permease n=2 Tax=Endozoicomonas montiporae TaxID=1027273 RepID=A0A081N049_9GAMM|nr:iron ABC transporter permease [Endozoicomonas montiporae]AMO58838.1 iron(III) transport system permease protein [Endozoicomonas montiporae CL-33]KEQ11822.1 iron ABC transporter permease [Endozoicomonas montiporae]